MTDIAATLRCALFLSIASIAATNAAGSTPVASRSDFIGAWRLVQIEYRGPHGALPDPYYAPDAIGSLIYDATGDMSVQITEPHRAPAPVPDDRRRAPLEASAAAARARAFDSYYAYYGRWEYDADRSVIVHHVEASLIPEETGRSYTQRVSFEAGRLVFTNVTGSDDGRTVRRKIWERSH